MSYIMYCHHCGQLRITRPRNLCVVCFADPAIRDRYPARTTNRRDRLYDVAPATEPTDARAGSRDKLAILQHRAAQRVELFHPDDRTAKTK